MFRRTSNPASHIKIPQYRTFWDLTKQKKYLGFAYDVDACNPGIAIDKETMDTAYTEEVHELFKEFDKDLRIDKEVKQKVLALALAQVHDCSEKLEAYWAKKSQKFQMPELAETNEFCGLNVYGYITKGEHITEPGLGFCHSSRNTGTFTDAKLEEEQSKLFKKAKEEFYGAE